MYAFGTANWCRKSPVRIARGTVNVPSGCATKSRAEIAGETSSKPSPSTTTVTIIYAAVEQASAASDRDRLTVIADEDDCGQICSQEFDSQRPGRYYPLLRKHVHCPAILQRMARQPTVAVSPAPRYPPLNMVSDFTLAGRCPLSPNVVYFDQSNSTSSKQPFYFNASRSVLFKDDMQ